MNRTVDIALVTSDAEAQASLASLTQADEDLGIVDVYQDLAALSAHLEHGSAPIAIVDIDPNPTRMIEELEPIINQFVHTRFIVLAAELSSDIMMRAMQAGVRHLQPKSTVDQELTEVLRKLATGTPAQAKRTGSAITVLSAGGGVGATTLVVNLANELQLASSEPVLVVDLDYVYGAVSSYLELEGQYGIADVLGYDGCIDLELIETTMVRHSEDIHVLLSPASVDLATAKPLAFERLGEAVGACKHGHRFTIFDAPRVPIDAAATLAHASEMTLIVFQPLVKDIRVARNMIKALSDKGVPLERIQPIMNRYRKRGEMISFDEATKALGGIKPECLSNDYTSALLGINYGKLLSSAAPRSALRKDLVHLATQYSDLEAIKNGNGTH